ncbi:MAG: efflux RND transporter permease subunit, partial [Spirochaetales bacterium]|nr:efflux RND transporter permease subunit [Spirochaetales bacterium]
MKTTKPRRPGGGIPLPLRRPVGTLMIGAALVLGGLGSLSTIDMDFLPDISVPKISVIAPYQGLPAAEIREMITLPLEESLLSLKGLKNMESLSRDGLALLELSFPWGTDRALAGLQTREIIDTAYLTLPSEAEKPQVLPVDPGDLPIIVLAVYPKAEDLSLARRLSEREIRMRLQQIEGVGSIQIRGGLEEEIHLEADPSLLAGRGLSIPTLAEEISGMNMDYPVGTVTEGSVEYLVKVKARAESLQELEDIYLPGTTCRLKDLAALSLGTKKQQSFFLGWNNEDNPPTHEGVMILMRRQGGFSPRLMAEHVKKELANIRRSYAGDLDIRLILDRSAILNRSFRDLAVSLLLGAGIAFVVLLIFIRNHRQALIVLLSMPSSLLWALLFLNLTGRTFNLMSLGGLALGVGMVVDNAIVVTERLGRLSLNGKSQKERAGLLAPEISRIAPSLIGSTVTTIVVFTPLLFLSGMNGSLFLDLALGVVFALVSSLLIALTVIPVLFLLLKPQGEQLKRRDLFFSFFRKLSRKSLRRPALVFIILSVIGVAGILSLARLPMEILPPLNEGRLYFRI